MTLTQFLIILSTLIVGFGTIYFKGYFAEWGKNTATKKDIQEITNQVEAVKIEFTKEIEHLRGDLLFKNTIKGIMYADKKDAIIKLYEAVHLWFETLDNHLISGILYDNARIEEAEKEIDKCDFNVSLAESKAELYVDDEKFFEMFNSYWQSINELQHLVNRLMIEYNKINNQKFNTASDKLEAQRKLHIETFDKSKAIRNQINDKWHEFRAACFKKISKP